MRSSKSHVVVVIALCLLGTGCNNKKKQSAENRPIINQPTLSPAPSASTAPTQVPTPDPTAAAGSGNQPLSVACSTQDVGVEAVKTGVYFDLRNGAVKSVSADLTGVGGSPSLRSGVVRTVVHSMEAVEDCRNGANCGAMSVTKQAQALKVCANAVNFPRENLESIGMSALFHVEAISKLYQSLDPTHPQFGKIEILLMPKFSSRYDNRTEIMSDNLSYYPDIGGRPNIVVFPKGDAGRKIWPQVNLWESAWVISHEASHHVFRILLASNRPSALIGEDLLKVVDAHDHPIIRLPATTSDGLGLQAQTRAVGTAEIVAAVNEGFADLFGFYAAGANADIFNGLACFAKNRDILSPNFAEGTPKILSQEVINTYLSTSVVNITPKSGVMSCDIPSFQDEHAIGAIIVQGLHQLYSEVAADNRGKAELAVRWVEGMPKSFTGTQAALLESLVRVGVQSATQSNRILTPAQCRVVRRVFPAYAGAWLDGNAAPFTCR